MNFKDGKIVQDSVQIDSIQFLKTKNYKDYFKIKVFSILKKTKYTINTFDKKDMEFMQYLLKIQDNYIYLKIESELFTYDNPKEGLSEYIKLKKIIGIDSVKNKEPTF
jgi:hypothetical protein